jgi:hypothetical protein
MGSLWCALSSLYEKMGHSIRISKRRFDVQLLGEQRVTGVTLDETVILGQR